MHKNSRIFSASTPVRNADENVSLSLSDIKSSSSANFDIDGKKKVSHKRKNIKAKERRRKLKRRKWIESSESDIEDNINKDTPHLFESPERIRDAGIEKDKDILSPLPIYRRENEENEIIDKEEELLSLDEDEIKIKDPIFHKSKVLKTYPPKTKEKWQKRSLVNKGTWLIDLKAPTPMADLLWDNYIKEYNIELSSGINDSEQRDSPSECNKDSDTDKDNEDLLSRLITNGNHLLKRNKTLYVMKGSLNSRNENMPMKVKRVIYVSDDDEIPSTSDAQKVAKRRHHVRTIDQFDHRNTHDEDDLREKDGTLISFNKFHAKSKMEKDTDYSSSTSQIKIKSVEKPQGFVHKRLDGNFNIIKK